MRSNEAHVTFDRRVLISFAVVLGVVCAPSAEARQSGGYSNSGRTPSFGGGGVSRTPSVGGGGYSRGGGSTFGMPSAGDRAFNQERSGNALGQYRQQQELSRRAQVPQPAPQYAPNTNGGGFVGGQSYTPPGRTYYRDSQGRFESRQNWYADRGWAAPPAQYYNQGPRSFGVWDGIFIWSLLNNLGRSGSGDWFSNHRDDAGYQQWRQEAERQAQTNTELRQKLDQLDSQLREKQGQPRDPSYLPPDVPPSVAAAPAPERTPPVAAARSGSGWVWPVLLVGGGGLGYLAFVRNKSSGTSSMAPSTPLGQAANLVRNKLSGASYTPDRFRVGMTISVDPTPFILAGPGVKAQPPETSSGQISVEAIGVAESGGARLTRLYLPGERGMIQLHLDAAGLPDECRYFTMIDEITPADTQEWGAWLDPAEGMIGWPDFQTKDGKSYTRVWSPGQSRTAPRELAETIQGTAGTRTVKNLTMLYAAPTGAAVPAPQTEYILVQAVEDGARASVQISAGLDINPATLQLA